MRIGPHGNPKSPGEAKVRQFDDPMHIDEEVLRLEVAVEDTVRVAELDPFQHLVRVALQR